MTDPTTPVSRSTMRVFLAVRGESAGQAPRFFRAFPSDATVTAAVGAVFLVVFFDGVPPVRGDVVVSPVSASAVVSAAAFLPVASRCLATPKRSGAVTFKN
jgi:hypothetical protein